MPEDELDRFDLSNVESQEEARRAEAPRTAQSAPQGRNTAQAKRRAVRSAYYAGRADAQSEQAAREAVYEEGNTEAAAQPVQADVAQAQATDAAVPTAAQTDVAAQTAAQASQADARMQGGAPKGSPCAKGELSAKLTEGSSSRAARKRLPDWTNTRGGLVRQDSAGENLNRQQMAHLRVLEALGRKYNVVFVTRDSISVESSAAEARRAEVASTRSAQPRNTAQANAQGGAKEGNRANARYDGGRVFEVALDAQEGAYTYFATHEMAHYLKSQGADFYAALEDSVRTWARAAGIDFDARVQAAQERYARAGQELTQEQAAEEVVGDMLGTIFADPSAAQELLNNAPRSVLEKIRDFISELLDTISTAARRIAGAKDLTALTELEGWARSMAKMLDEAMLETGRRQIAQAETGIRFSLQTLEDGTPYVRIDTDQEQFDGLSQNEIIREARKAILEKFRGKVIGSAANPAFVNRQSADEYTHPAKWVQQDTHIAKMRASTELDNLLRASTLIRHVEDDGRHERATGGWSTYRTLFSVDGQMYEGEIQIMHTERGRLFYDMTQIKKANIRATAVLQEDASRAASTDVSFDSIISEGRGKVKRQNSAKREKAEQRSDTNSDSDIRYSLADEGESTPGITLEDVNTLRSIGRKSINAFTSEEIRATEPWARKFYRELGTKSPFFRAWFGDWRANDEMEVEVPKVDTIAIDDVVLDSGDYHINDTGWNVYAGKTLREETRHYARGEKISYRALKSIEAILGNAVLLDTTVSQLSSANKSKGTAFMHKLYTMFFYDDNPYLAKVSIEEFYDYG